MNNNYEIDFSPESAPLRRTGLLIYTVAITVLLVLLGRNALINSEGAIALCVREFASGMDVFAGESLCQPDSSAVLFAGKIFRQLTRISGISEWSLRLIPAFFALLLFAGVMRFAGMMFDRKTAFTAGWMLLGSYGFLHWGRHISWHMILAAWMMWCAVLMLKREAGYFRIFFLWLLLFLGVLWWGAYFLLPMAAIMVFFPPRVRILPVIISMAVAAGIVFWLTYFPGRSWGEDLRIAVDTVWRGWLESCRVMVYPGIQAAWWAGWENLPRLILPWVPVSIAAIGGLCCRWRELPENVRKLLFAGALMFLLIGVFPGKKWQYMLPLLPPVVILTAGGIAGECGIARWNRIADLVMSWGFSLIGALTAAIAVTFPLWDMLLKVSPPLVLMILVPAMGFLAVGLLVFDTGPTCAEEKVSGMCGAWSGYILAGVVLSAAVWCVTIPAMTKFRTGRPFWKKCAETIRNMPPGNVILAGTKPSAMIYFYLNGTAELTCVPKINELAGHCKQIIGDEAVIIAGKDQLEAIRQVLDNTSWHLEHTPAVKEGEPLRLPGERDDGRMELYQLRRVSVNGAAVGK